jgi:hypothetical protein
MGKYENHLLCESIKVSPICTSDKCSSEFEMIKKHWWNVTNRGSGNIRRLTCLFAAWFAINPTRNGCRSKLVLSCGKETINRPSHWIASKNRNYPGLIWRHILCVAVNISVCSLKTGKQLVCSEKQKIEIYSKCGVDFLKCNLVVYRDTTDFKV